MQGRPGPFDRYKPHGEPFDPDDVPVGLPGDKPVSSESELWFYIGKGMLILIAAAFLLTNAMYGFFELLVFLAGE
jgi:hypothetical protein